MQMKVRLQCSKNWTELSWQLGAVGFGGQKGLKGRWAAQGGVADVLPFSDCNDNDQDNEDALVVKGKGDRSSATKTSTLLKEKQGTGNYNR